ncbi:hypothetical protein EV286_104343 [Rhizobium sp. BK251]|nr:hypothetical protein EV286_104343 [Rhizobium sp. BK251]
MLEAVLNSLTVVLIASAFFTTALAAVRGRDVQDKSLQKVPVRVSSRRRQNG